MRTIATVLLALLAVTAAPHSRAAQTWTAGKDYFEITPAQPTNVAPGKVEVREVFSYACPACNRFRGFMRQIKKDLPANAQLFYLPAAFNPSEDWPMFQRAYFAAKALGIAEKTHQAMYDAIWGGGELETVDPATGRLKKPLPTIEDAAKFYARVAGVKPADFLAAANSFSVDLQMKRADAYIKATQVQGTPTLIVNGKYRLNLGALQTADKIVDLIKWLVAKESGQ